VTVKRVLSRLGEERSLSLAGCPGVHLRWRLIVPRFWGWTDGLIGLPVKETKDPGPCVDFGPAVLTFETAGMVIRVLLLRGFVGSPTFGAGEYYCGLRSAAHLRSMLPDVRGSNVAGAMLECSR